MAILSEQAYRLIARLLNCIEAGAPWPEGAKYVRIAPLHRPGEDPLEPQQHKSFRCRRLALVLGYLFLMCLVDMAKMDPSNFLFEEEVCAAVVLKRRRKRQKSTKKWVQSETMRRSWEAL